MTEQKMTKLVLDLTKGIDENAAIYFEKAKKINSEAPGYLAEAALEVGALLIHYSTDYVFDGKKKRGYKEDDEPKPISRYGETKLLGERAVITLSGKGLKWHLIRTSKLFGPKGESEMAKESFFDLILRLSRERKEFNMVHNEEVSCFTYTPDLAKETKNLIESGKGCGIYHITNSGPASWYEAAKYLFELKNITDIKLNAVLSSDYPRPAKRPKYSVLLNTKLEPMRGWQEALRNYLKM